MQKYDTLLVSQIEPSILQLTLNRPSVRNAINSKMMEELHSFWSQINLYENDIRCIIITGSGEAAFCAGADIKERQDLPTQTWKLQHIALEKAMVAMTTCNIPIIAAVNGAAFGGGLELVLACDFAYAGQNATFAQSEVKLGIIPGAMGTQNLPIACGLRRAKELCFTGAMFDAKQAWEWGIINQITEPQELIPETIKTARIIVKNAPLAIKQAKSALNFSLQTTLQKGYQHEIDCYNQTLDTKDRFEGINAFLEKRSANFSGE